jgi:hypothetical protein
MIRTSHRNSTYRFSKNQQHDLLELKPQTLNLEL